MNHETRHSLIELLAREGLPHSMLQTIEQVYEPLANRVRRASATRDLPYVVGLCGPQGSGKSTIAAILRELLIAGDVSTTIFALDDFYLTRLERQRLARDIHPLLAARGVPGTHDVALMERTMAALGERTPVSMPSFDKASDDRRPRTQWTSIVGPVDVILFEGWCVGAHPQGDAALAEPLNTLEEREDANGTWRRYVNECLRGDYQRLFARIDAQVLLEAPNFEVVFRWRSEQERKLRERLEGAGQDASRLMDDAALARFIAHYERLTRHIMIEMPARADVVIKLDAARRVERVRGL